MVSVDPTEAEFNRRMLRVYDDSRDKAGYRPIRYLQMVRRRGGVESARRLLAKKGISAGFEALTLAGHRDLTVESLVLEPTFRVFFSAEELEVARRRLQS